VLTKDIDGGTIGLPGADTDGRLASGGSNAGAIWDHSSTIHVDLPISTHAIFNSIENLTTGDLSVPRADSIAASSLLQELDLAEGMINRTGLYANAVGSVLAFVTASTDTADQAATQLLTLARALEVPGADTVFAGLAQDILPVLGHAMRVGHVPPDIALGLASRVAAAAQLVPEPLASVFTSFSDALQGRMRGLNAQLAAAQCLFTLLALVTTVGTGFAVLAKVAGIVRMAYSVYRRIESVVRGVVRQVTKVIKRIFRFCKCALHYVYLNYRYPY
jgi:hypothetical protein